MPEPDPYEAAFDAVKQDYNPGPVDLPWSMQRRLQDLQQQITAVVENQLRQSDKLEMQINAAIVPAIERALANVPRTAVQPARESELQQDRRLVEEAAESQSKFTELTVAFAKLDATCTAMHGAITSLEEKDFERRIKSIRQELDDTRSRIDRYPKLWERNHEELQNKMTSLSVGHDQLQREVQRLHDEIADVRRFVRKEIPEADKEGVPSESVDDAGKKLA